MRLGRKKKEIDQFSEKLEQALDALATGAEISVEEEMDDSLWGKISVRFKRLQEIWSEKEEESKKDKQQMKELISDISHQTKTPIANLKVYLELLQAGDLDEKETAEFLNRMEQQTKMSRLETGIIEIRKKDVSVYDTLYRAVSAIVPRAGKKQMKIYVDCEEDLTVSHDSKWTEEAVFNLLENAVKYTDAGGKIWISAKKEEFFTRISVKDTGKGIAKERQAEIFQRFYREPEVHDEEGIGVGLYLAREIISMQEGYIEVVSEAGAGAEFRIFLPNG